MQGLVLAFLTLAAIAISVFRLSPKLKAMMDAKPAGRMDRVSERVSFLIPEIGLHRRLLKFRLSGVIHAIILFSFVVLLTAILQSYLSAFLPGFHGFRALAVLQDICAVTMLLGVGLALWHRLIVKPARYEGSNGRDALIILALITTIVVTMELEFTFLILSDKEGGSFHPLARGLAGMFKGISTGAAASTATTFFWLHIGAVLAFLIYIPGSKHLHMFLAIPNIFFRNLGARTDLNYDPDSAAPAQIADFSWKDLLDGYSCTECGRCQSVCPAYAEDLPLSPKSLIMQLRDASTDSVDHNPIAGNVIASETLWACTTCTACMEVCPLHIEHVPKIVNLRRSLVDEGDIDDATQKTLMSFQKYGNSFRKPVRQRPKWTKELEFEIPNAQSEPVDYLWYVGDYASFHPKVTEKTQNFARILKAAGVSFGILYDKEKNAGNDLRRMGEEGLFQDIALENIDEITAAQFKKIITTDPHSLNTLLNEYGALGLDIDVLHYTELLTNLLSEGKVDSPATGAGRKVTFHDPCYLGRYNGKYDAPRDLIRAAGYELVEMPRNRENSFCCGAGGGRIFMEDPNTGGERPSEARIREALELDGVELFVVTCPKDVVMYSAAIETLQVTDRIEVREISELITAPAKPRE